MMGANFQCIHQFPGYPAPPCRGMNQEFGNVCTMRLVFGLINNELNGPNKGPLRIFSPQNNAFSTRDTLCNTRPKRPRLIAVKREHKTDRCAIVHALFKDITKLVDSRQDLFRAQYKAGVWVAI
ncbi:Uncharacterised protein [Citrobacter youngae]|nr:Uncharacterised protein [Citrobacter youngae]